MVVIGTDWSKSFNKGHLANLLIGMGAPQNSLKGNVKVRTEHFKGKKAYILVTAPPEGEVDDQGRKKFANKNFITATMYQNAKKVAAMSGGSVVSISRGAPAASSTPATPAAASTDLNSMFGPQ
jgi:hypothetical protein